MSDTIVNFRKAKKKVKRSRKELTAAQNREKFGKTKAQNLKEETAREKAKNHLDGHKLDE